MIDVICVQNGYIYVFMFYIANTTFYMFFLIYMHQNILKYVLYKKCFQNGSFWKFDFPLPLPLPTTQITDIQSSRMAVGSKAIAKRSMITTKSDLYMLQKNQKNVNEILVPH